MTDQAQADRVRAMAIDLGAAIRQAQEMPISKPIIISMTPVTSLSGGSGGRGAVCPRITEGKTMTDHEQGDEEPVEVRDLRREMEALRGVLGDRAEYLCESCNTVHQPQSPRFLQPCPTCSKAMLPTSLNRREISKLKQERDELKQDACSMELLHAEEVRDLRREVEAYKQHDVATRHALGLTGFESRSHAAYIVDLQMEIRALKAQLKH